ncbi:hypothetical protein IAT40_004925 [Kwoniella sp. CBS 6097]
MRTAASLLGLCMMLATSSISVLGKPQASGTEEMAAPPPSASASPAIILQAEANIKVNGNDGPEGEWVMKEDDDDEHTFAFSGTYTTESFEATLFEEDKATKTVGCIASAPASLTADVSLIVVTGSPFAKPTASDAAKAGMVCTAL